MTSSTTSPCPLAGSGGDRAAVGGVPGGVVEQVGHDLVQSSAVGVDNQLIWYDVDRVSHRPAGQLCLVDAGLQKVGQGYGGAVQLGGAGFDAGQVEQLADQGAQPLGLGERGPQGVRIWGRYPVDQVLQHRTQGRDRRTKLVADVGDQLSALAVDVPEVLCHPVEGMRQLAHLVLAGAAHPPGVVTSCHRRCGGRHLTQWRRHAASQHLGHEQGHHDGDGQGVSRSEPVMEAGPHDQGRHGAGGSDQHAQLGLQAVDRVQWPQVEHATAGGLGTHGSSGASSRCAPDRGVGSAE